MKQSPIVLSSVYSVTVQMLSQEPSGGFVCLLLKQLLPVIQVVIVFKVVIFPSALKLSAGIPLVRQRIP